MKNYRARTVDEYITSADIEARMKLQEIRKIIKSTIPGVEEGISWGVPFYKYHGLLVGFAVFKSHVSFGLVTVLQSKDREILEKRGYVTGKKTIQIRFDQKVPNTIIRRILKAKAEKNKAKRK